MNSCSETERVMMDHYPTTTVEIDRQEEEEEDVLALLDDFTISSDDDITINDDTIPHILSIQSDLNQYDHTKIKGGEEEYSWDILNPKEFVKGVHVPDSKYTTESDWDILSSVQSIISMETNQTDITTQRNPTYSSIVSKNDFNSKSQIENSHKRMVLGVYMLHDTIIRPKKCAISTKKASIYPRSMENYCEYDDREGYKFARGGKSALMFRGNQKHSKRNNGGKQRESSQNYRKVNSRKYTSMM